MQHENDRRDHPVKEGEIVEATCEAEGEKGDGIFKVKGFVIIVPGKYDIGQTCKIKVTAIRGRVSFGELAEDQQ